MNALVTGAAGFVGSTLVDRLLADGHWVRGLDNFSTGKREFLAGALNSSRFNLVAASLSDQGALDSAMDGIDVVFHLAANADVRHGPDRPRRDLEHNTIGTANVLEAMRKRKVGHICFSSTGSVYGEAPVIPTPEDAPFPVQTSLYGASKLAGEGMIAAYCEAYPMRSWIFRFVSILGERYTHGHIFDFYKQLSRDPSSLSVLGDGRQRKSYLYVQDCLNAMLLALERASGKVNVMNLGTDEVSTVNDSIGWITAHLGLSPRIEYSGGIRGWIGDNPFIFLDCSRIRALGWRPRLTIREGVERTIRWLSANPRFLEDARTEEGHLESIGIADKSCGEK